MKPNTAILVSENGGIVMNIQCVPPLNKSSERQNQDQSKCIFSEASEKAIKNN